MPASETKSCPAIVITAPASNQGKTMVTAALARFHRDQRMKVKVFKTGPDFLDPMILEQASGQTVDHLDLWMVGESLCRQRLFKAAGENDLIIVEGVMGLFDGDPSTADLARLFNIPVAAVIDASGMAQTLAAVSYGLAKFEPELNYLGTIANRVASERHAQMLTAGFDQGTSKSGLRFLGSLSQDKEISLPSRHLGLVQAQEIEDLDKRIHAASIAIGKTELANLPPKVEFSAATGEPVERHLAGKKIAVAKDNAFAFTYHANLELLEEMGATLSYFSPLKDEVFGEVDCLYLPGGYPELYLDELSQNQRSKERIQDHAKEGGAIYAECGGMLYLLDSLTDSEGKRADLVGLIPGNASMQKRLSALGHQYLNTEHGILRGHTFHYSKLDSTITPATSARRKTDDQPGEHFYELGNIRASYLHLYFPTNPKAAASLFGND